MGKKKKTALKPTIPTGSGLRMGSIVSCYTSYGADYSVADKLLTGQVIYIHPRRRFYTVEFEVGGRTFRENYYIGALQSPEKGENHEDDKHFKS